MEVFIPIGLKESGPLERKCDIAARKFLGPKRGCSVFRIAVRKTAHCDGSYMEASNTNFELTGKKNIQTNLSYLQQDNTFLKFG